MTDSSSSSSSSSPPSAGASSSHSQAGRDRPQGISKRRENKHKYHNVTRFFNSHAFPAAAISSPQGHNSNHNSSRIPVQIHQQSFVPGPTEDPVYTSFLAFQQAGGNEISGFEQQFHHRHIPDESYPLRSLGSYTFPSLSPNSSLPPQSTPVSPLAGEPSQVSGHGFQFARQAGAVDVFASDSEDMSVPGSRVGSFDSLDSFNSMALSIGTQASSVTDGYVYPVVDSTFGSPTMDSINDLTLPGALLPLSNLEIAAYQEMLGRHGSHLRARLQLCSYLLSVSSPKLTTFSL
jgi:hypothetical protein